VLSDLSGRGNHARLENGAIVSQGSVALEGGRQYVSTSYAPNLDGQSLSWELWFKDGNGSSPAVATALVSNYSTITVSVVHLGVDEAGHPTTFMRSPFYGRQGVVYGNRNAERVGTDEMKSSRMRTVGTRDFDTCAQECANNSQCDASAIFHPWATYASCFMMTRPKWAPASKTDNGSDRYFVKNSARTKPTDLAKAGSTRSADGQEVRARGGATLSDGRWHHVAFVVHGGSQTLYVDGEVEARTAAVQGRVTSGQALVIGGNHLERFRQCKIGPVRLFRGPDGSYSTDAVRSRYSAELPRFQKI
jgi:hypothetical protein